MKNWKSLIIIFVISASFTFYRSYYSKPIKPEFNKILVENLYSVEAPEYLKKMEVTNKDASLQLIDLNKELYLMVINELKTETIFEYNEYFEKMQERFKLQLRNIKTLEKQDLIINGLNSKSIFVQGETNGQTVYWKIYLVEGETYFHQIITWSPIENRTYFESDLRRLVRSFRES